MIGKTKIFINQNTMREAMQLWVTANFIQPMAVVGIEKQSCTYAPNEEFVLELDAPVVIEPHPVEDL